MSVEHRPIADVIRPLLASVLGDPLPLRFEFWDASTAGPEVTPATIRLNSPDAVRQLLWAPGELGLGRAYVNGDLDVEGDIVEGIRALRGAPVSGAAVVTKLLPGALDAARKLGVVGRPATPPEIEARPKGWRHTLRRDASVISHHYDVGNDFYRLVLGRAMTYSCARFTDEDDSLELAQASKHELICNKLGLSETPGLRLLDIGCGWGAMAIHAARHHGARVLGVTLSEAQEEYSREAVKQAGVADLVEIRRCDYRRLTDDPFDAVSSIGMFEHVGANRADEYFEIVRRLVKPGGRFLNHAISSIGGSRLGRRSFMYRYVFPDGELLDVGDVVQRMERSGFEVRDVESLREHYAATLRAWIANLDANWEHAEALAGTARARVWRLYMAGSVVGFDDGGINIHQVLGCVPDPTGRSGMPHTRDGWSTHGMEREWRQNEQMVSAVT